MKKFFLIFALALVATSVLPGSVHAATLSKPGNNLGLAGFWSFNEGVGTSAGDFSGGGNDGTLVASPSWTVGKFVHGLSFDGTSQYVNLLTSVAPASVPTAFSDIANSNSYTFAAWVKTTGGTGASPFAWTCNETIFDTRNAGSTNMHGWAFGISSNKICTSRTNDYLNGQSLSGSATVNDGNWHHIAVSVSGNTATFYVDGALDTTATFTAAGAQGDNSVGSGTGNVNMQIGVRSRDGGQKDSNFFSGDLDEPRIYSRALSASEIRALYQQGAVAATGLNAQKLVAYFNMNEASGTSLKDFIGDGPLATIYNSPTRVAGKQGNALSFNGSNQYADFPLTVNYSQFTVSAWFKANSFAGANARIVANEHTDTNNPHKGFQLMFNNGGTSGFFDVGTGSGSGNHASANWTKTLSTGTWYHYVGVYDGRTAYAYIDGSLVGSDSVSGSTSKPITASGYNVNIGRNPEYNGDYFNGAIDDVRIYNRALSADEVAALYTAGIPEGKTTMNTSSADLQGSGLSNGLVGLWTFDGKDTVWSSSTAGTATDKSGNGHTGTLTNMTQSGSVAIGKMGQALSFDGTSSYVKINTFSQTIADGYSLSAWVKLDSGTVPNYQQIITSDNSNAARAFQFRIDGSGGGIELVRFDSSNLVVETVSTSGISVNDGQWHFVTATFSSSVGTQLYVDGVPYGSSSDLTQNRNLSTGEPILIGSRRSASPANLFSGLIDDARFYSRALSAREVKQLYDMGK